MKKELSTALMNMWCSRIDIMQSNIPAHLGYMEICIPDPFLLSSYDQGLLRSHQKIRDNILKKISNLFNNHFLKEEMLHLNEELADFFTISQFKFFSIFSDHLTSIQQNILIDNAVGFSYLTNLFQKNTSKEILSLMLQLFEERLSLEDDMLKKLNIKH